MDAWKDSALKVFWVKAKLDLKYSDRKPSKNGRKNTVILSGIGREESAILP